MNTYASKAIVNQFQLNTCLEEARDAVVSCESFLRGPYRDSALKEVRQLRSRLYAVFVAADDATSSPFELTREVEACIKRLNSIRTAAQYLAH